MATYGRRWRANRKSIANISRASRRQHAAVRRARRGKARQYRSY